VLGIFEGRDKDVSRRSIQVITILDSCFDIRQHFDDGEMIGHAITNKGMLFGQRWTKAMAPLTRDFD